ncbi:VOC family protein [Streptomyces sp. NBC_01716]|uniref:VOC family protein n=1 Tax=Streptomyces sp. NBC_01716 TaxID=2975917 RepID=UPI002E34ED1D|nr:VOC family protein [Streptomyces sp. NBC_01716]
MTSRVRHLTIDSTDAYRLGTFWAEVLGTTVAPDDNPGDDEVLVAADGITLLFVTVPEPKPTKNRLHVDLEPQDRTREEEITRLLTLGATLLSDHRRPDGLGWATLADIEGNEFCVERSRAERSSSTPAVAAEAP